MYNRLSEIGFKKAGEWKLVNDELANWYGKNFKLNDAVIVQILKKDEFKLLIPSKNQ